MKRLTVLVDAAPVVSFSVEANAAVTAGYSVTVSGLNFGVDATTPTSTIGLSSCATASWASTSSVICMLSMSEGVSHELRVTVSGVVGSRTSGFSYDGAAGIFCLFEARVLKQCTIGGHILPTAPLLHPSAQLLL